MLFFLEVILQLILEFAAYGVGRVFVMIFLPWYGIQPLLRDERKPHQFWKWRGFSYVDGGRRILRHGAVQLIGLAVIVGVAVMIGVIVS